MIQFTEARYRALFEKEVTEVVGEVPRPEFIPSRDGLKERYLLGASWVAKGAGMLRLISFPELESMIEAGSPGVAVERRRKELTAGLKQ